MKDQRQKSKWGECLRVISLMKNDRSFLLQAFYFLLEKIKKKKKTERGVPNQLYIICFIKYLQTSSNDQNSFKFVAFLLSTLYVISNIISVNSNIIKLHL